MYSPCPSIHSPAASPSILHLWSARRIRHLPDPSPNTCSTCRPSFQSAHDSPAKYRRRRFYSDTSDVAPVRPHGMARFSGSHSANGHLVAANPHRAWQCSHNSVSCRGNRRLSMRHDWNDTDPLDSTRICDVVCPVAAGTSAYAAQTAAARRICRGMAPEWLVSVCCAVRRVPFAHRNSRCGAERHTDLVFDHSCIHLKTTMNATLAGKHRLISFHSFEM